MAGYYDFLQRIRRNHVGTSVAANNVVGGTVPRQVAAALLRAKTVLGREDESAY